MSAPVLTLDCLSIHYGSTAAVRDLSLQVLAGEVYGLLGPNGSGKSSTLSAIAGLVRPTEGSIRLQGISPGQDPFAYRALLGYVPQELSLFEELTSCDNLRFFGQLYGLSGRALALRVAEVLEFIQLTELAQRTVRTLSGGMQRRLNLGCALLHRPPLLLLDEPTVGLDITARDGLFENLRDLRAQGCALIFTTHHLEEAEQLCDRIGLMQQGRLTAEGTLDELDEALASREATPSRVRRPRLERLYLEWTARSLAQR